MKEKIFPKKSVQNTVEHTLQARIELSNNHRKELKIRSEYELEASTFLDLDYDLHRINNFDGLKAINFSRLIMMKVLLCFLETI